MKNTKIAAFWKLLAWIKRVLIQTLQHVSLVFCREKKSTAYIIYTLLSLLLLKSNTWTVFTKYISQLKKNPCNRFPIPSPVYFSLFLAPKTPDPTNQIINNLFLSSSVWVRPQQKKRIKRSRTSIERLWSWRCGSPSGCCSQTGCVRPPAASQRRSTSAGQEGCLDSNRKINRLDFYI